MAEVPSTPDEHLRTQPCGVLRAHGDHYYNGQTGYTVRTVTDTTFYCRGRFDATRGRLVRTRDIEDLREALGYDD